MAVAKIKTIEKDFGTRLCSEVLYTVLSKVLVALLCLAGTAHRREWWRGPRRRERGDRQAVTDRLSKWTHEGG